MLEVVRQTLVDLDDLRFEEFFDRYLMEVQDANLLSEIRTTIQRNNSDTLLIETLVQQQHERLVNK